MPSNIFHEERTVTEIQQLFEEMSLPGSPTAQALRLLMARGMTLEEAREQLSRDLSRVLGVSGRSEEEVVHQDSDHSI